ncbi:hypothetical protein [Streptomyces sp. NPDC055642]
MLNNQIIITDRYLFLTARRGMHRELDAGLLRDCEWDQLCDLNINSPRAKLVQCGFCWVDHGELQWMQTFTNHRGNRVVRHQPGESQDHPYKSVETPRHKGYKRRACLVGDREGLRTGSEVPAEDGRTIADALLEGVLPLDYEHQHSDFSRDRGLTKRIGLIAGAGRVPMFHTDQDAIFKKQTAPILRTDGKVPLEWIEDLDRPLIVTGGLREIILFTCDVRNGVYCPKGRIAGCGKTHARTEPLRGVTLDQALVHGALDEFRYVMDAKVTKLPRSFWTTRECHERYISALGASGEFASLEGAPTGQAKTSSGRRNGHSRDREAGLDAMYAQAVDLANFAPADQPFTRPRIEARPVPRCLGCGWPLVLPDGEPFPECWRCDGKAQELPSETAEERVEIEDVPARYAVYALTADLRCAGCGDWTSTTDRYGIPLHWGCTHDGPKRGRAA